MEMGNERIDESSLRGEGIYCHGVFKQMGKGEGDKELLPPNLFSRTRSPPSFPPKHSDSKRRAEVIKRRNEVAETIAKMQESGKTVVSNYLIERVCKKISPCSIARNLMDFEKMGLLLASSNRASFKITPNFREKFQKVHY